MKTLKTIQTLAKIGRVFSKVIFILCLVGAIGCAAGIISLAVIPESIKIGGVTIHGLIELESGIGMGTAYTAMVQGIILCAGEAVLSKLAELYFKRELEAGTPFTLDGAKELMRLGICAIAIPIGTNIIAGIAHAIMSAFFSGVGDTYSGSVSVGIGIMFIVMSLFCRYGAQLESGDIQADEAE